MSNQADSEARTDYLRERPSAFVDNDVDGSVNGYTVAELSAWAVANNVPLEPPF